MKKRIFLSILLIASWFPAHGGQVLVRPSQAGRATDTMIFSDQVSSFNDPSVGFQVRLNISCFGTNLRSVTNPVSPTGSIKFSMALRSGSVFSLVFPGWMVMNTEYSTMVPSPAPMAIVNNGTAFYVDRSPDSRDWEYEPPGRQNGRTSAYGNTIIFNAPPDVTPGVGITGTNYSTGDFASAISSVDIIQDVYSVVGELRLVKGKEQKKSEPWKVQKAVASFMKSLNWLSGSFVDSSFAGGDGGDGGDGGAGVDINDPGNIHKVIPLVEGSEYNRDAGWGQPRFAWWEQVKAQEAAYFPPIPNPLNYTNAPTELQKYMGKDGDITAGWEASWSSDFKVLNINASFPGQVNFCGGFFSPLMLFFDKQEPKFDRFVDFKMSSYANQTYWPEPNLNAAFLVLDRNRDGIINDVTEMFGSEDSDLNGFELLTVFDENNDGVIDRKDPIFPQLRLWRDSTGKAITLKKDLKSLKEAGVESISLRYSKNAFIGIAHRAELREQSSFTMIKNGKRIKGEVIDVWFANKR